MEINEYTWCRICSLYVPVIQLTNSLDNAWRAFATSHSFTPFELSWLARYCGTHNCFTCASVSPSGIFWWDQLRKGAISLDSRKCAHGLWAGWYWRLVRCLSARLLAPWLGEHLTWLCPSESFIFQQWEHNDTTRKDWLPGEYQCGSFRAFFSAVYCNRVFAWWFSP